MENVLLKRVQFELESCSLWGLVIEEVVDWDQKLLETTFIYHHVELSENLLDAQQHTIWHCSATPWRIRLLTGVWLRCRTDETHVPDSPSFEYFHAVGPTSTLLGPFWSALVQNLCIHVKMVPYLGATKRWIDLGS